MTKLLKRSRREVELSAAGDEQDFKILKLRSLLLRRLLTQSLRNEFAHQGDGLAGDFH